MRTCKTCGTTDAASFYETQGSQYCRPCHRTKYFSKGRARVRAAKLTCGACMDCGLKVNEENMEVFEFDHLRDKIYNVSSMVTMTDAKFNEEIIDLHRMRLPLQLAL